MYSQDLAIAVLNSLNSVTDVGNAEIDNCLQNIIASFDDVYNNRPFEIAFEQGFIDRLAERLKLIDELKGKIRKLPERKNPVEKKGSTANFSNNNSSYVLSDALIPK